MPLNLIRFQARAGNVDQLARFLFCLKKEGGGDEPAFERGRDVQTVATRVCAASARGMAAPRADGNKNEHCNAIAQVRKENRGEDMMMETD